MPDPSSTEPAASSERGPTAFEHMEELEASVRQRRPWALWLLLVPIAVVLYPPLYSHRHPQLGGVPFFVWYQIAAVIFGGVVTGIVYVLRGTESTVASSR